MGIQNAPPSTPYDINIYPNGLQLVFPAPTEYTACYLSHYMNSPFFKSGLEEDSGQTDMFHPVSGHGLYNVMDVYSEQLV